MTEDEKIALQQTMGQAFYEDVVRLEAQLARQEEDANLLLEIKDKALVALEEQIAASEQEHQDFRLQNDAEWRAKLDHLKAQIAAKDAALGIYFMIDADKAFAHLLAMNEGKKR